MPNTTRLPRSERPPHIRATSAESGARQTLPSSRWVYVAHEDDPVGVEAIRALNQEAQKALHKPYQGVIANVRALKKGLLGLNLRTKILKKGEKAPANSVSFFTPGENQCSRQIFPGRHLRSSSARLWQLHYETEGGIIPEWAQTTPHVKAVQRHQDKKLSEGERQKHFAEAALREVMQMEYWTNQPFPWLQEESEASQEYQAKYQWWVDWAQYTQEVTLSSIIRGQTRPVIVDPDHMEHLEQSSDLTALFVGCPAYNRPHTDVAESLLQAHTQKARSTIASILNDLQPHLQEAVFLNVDEDFEWDDRLKGTLHPFFYPSIQEIENQTGYQLNGTQRPRMDGQTGARTSKEVARSLNHNFNLLDEEIVRPVQQLLDVPFSSQRWSDLLGQDRIQHGYEIARNNQDFAEKLQPEANNQLERYATDALGIERALANMTLYIALALWLRENPHTILIDAEVDPGYWEKMLPLLDRLWEERPVIVALPKSASQPWSY